MALGAVLEATILSPVLTACSVLCGVIAGECLSVSGWCTDGQHGLGRLQSHGTQPDALEGAWGALLQEFTWHSGGA